jgi:hypothetical protein
MVSDAVPYRAFYSQRRSRDPFGDRRLRLVERLADDVDQAGAAVRQRFFEDLASSPGSLTRRLLTSKAAATLAGSVSKYIVNYGCL